VVLSTWQGSTCLSTLRLDRAEVVELLAALGSSLLVAAQEHPAGT
jgi:hypothetical protein